MKRNKSEVKPKTNNDIKDLANFEQLTKIKLDLDSPRMKMAMQNLGINKEDLEVIDIEQFEEKRLAKDGVDLRYRKKVDSTTIEYLYKVKEKEL